MNVFELIWCPPGEETCDSWSKTLFPMGIIYSFAYVAILIPAWLNCFEPSSAWASWGSAGEAREELQRRIEAWHAAMFLGFWWVKENTPRLAIYS